MPTKRLLLLTAVLLLAGGPVCAQGYDTRLAAADVLHYAFSLDLNDSTDVVRGAADITVRFREAATEFVVDLASPPAEKQGMTVKQIQENGKVCRFTHRNDHLLISLPVPAEAGEEHTFRIDYAGVPTDGLIISRNKFGDRTFFGDNWPNRAHYWLPCVDHPAEKATVEFIVTAPDHYQVIANGVQIEETNLPNERKLTHWRESVPLPTKVIVIGAAPFAVQYVGDVEGIPLSSWVFPRDRDAGFYDYAQAAGILQWFIRQVAPYPYEKLANVQSKTRYGGMENAGNIFYSEQAISGDRSNESLLAHEIAHQWFGNSASEASWYHVWLSEGFATYFTNLYFEQTHGRDAMVARLEEERSTALGFASRYAAPVVDTTAGDYNELLNPNSYQKGGWVLHMLRREVGDEAFWKGIRTYYDRYRLSNALTDDLRRVMEEVSGRDLTTFFRQWLYRPGFPDLAVTWRYEAASRELRLEVRQQQTGGPFLFPLDVAALVPGKAEPQRFSLEVTQMRQEFTLPLDASPTKITLDPDVWLLFEGKITGR